MKNLKSFEKIILDNFVYNILLISSLILCEVLVFFHSMYSLTTNTLSPWGVSYILAIVFVYITAAAA